MTMPTADPDFEKRARLALVWQDLVTPVGAILGYQEIIVEQAERLQLQAFAADLDKVLQAAAALLQLVNSLKDARFSLGEDEPDGIGGIQAKLRHDLRTPLNAILGYTEMMLEDMETVPAAEALRPDCDKLLGEARRLLDRIDAIVDFTRPATASGQDDPVGDSDLLVADLLRTLRPGADAAKLLEVGRILVVDDDPNNRDLLSRRLTLEGHEVVLASSGKEALHILEEQAFDLILLDVLMAEMNGIEVLMRLKADPRLRHTPVIMVSGLSEQDAVIRCIEAGAEDYLPKPFNVVLLRARINASLERNRWREREREYLRNLQIEKDRSEALLRNIFPDPIVDRLNAGETAIADRFENVAILFADIVGFTPAAANMSPARVVERLNRLFTEFDILALRHGVEKIKTIGDAYMAATGLPEPRGNHAEAIAAFALSIVDVVRRLNGEEQGPPFEIRIGIHAGPVIAGVIGQRRYIYDIWGDTVNVASRLESHGIARQIQVSEEVRAALAYKYDFEPRSAIPLKGRGMMEAFLLVPPAEKRRDEQLSALPDGPADAGEDGAHLKG